ncbi:LysR family transcriptional regulator [Azospirillum canadense]|uniref:LysR family transcriptional regulator n=1 Tax=Azospirillum canadense TaxID=403962 RepID=UPI002227EB25|nr:LysR family transcriptional regulator [Azospirillum canadense]MCW2235972.1 molybdate transport repressor ModE-like protein [Azospirillum canadense]
MTVQKRSAPPSVPLAAALDWDDLRVFLELARVGSLSAAARALGLSHATVGRRIAALEATLGRPLVDRRPDGYGLTVDGEAVRALAEGMDERALAILRRAGGGEELAGTVRLTMTQALADRFLVPRLARLRARHPALDLEVIADNRSLSLARREADLAIRLARPQSGELFARRLATVGYALHAAPGAPDVLVGFDEALADLPEAAWLARHAGGRRIAFRSNSVQAQLAAAKGGFGAALLPCWLAAEEAGLEQLPTTAPPLVREAWLVVHRDRKDVPRVRAVIDHIVELFEAERALLAGEG